VATLCANNFWIDAPGCSWSHQRQLLPLLFWQLALGAPYALGLLVAVLKATDVSTTTAMLTPLLLLLKVASRDVSAELYWLIVLVMTERCEADWPPTRGVSTKATEEQGGQRCSLLIRRVSNSVDGGCLRGTVMTKKFLTPAL
jgi:hypothetical protein